MKAFHQAMENVIRGELIGSVFKEDQEGLETFLEGNRDINELDVQGIDEVIGA